MDSVFIIIQIGPVTVRAVLHKSFIDLLCSVWTTGIQVPCSLSLRQLHVGQRHRLYRGSSPFRLQPKCPACLSSEELNISGHQQHGRLHHWMGKNVWRKVYLFIIVFLLYSFLRLWLVQWNMASKRGRHSAEVALALFIPTVQISCLEFFSDVAQSIDSAT